MRRTRPGGLRAGAHPLGAVLAVVLAVVLAATLPPAPASAADRTGPQRRAALTSFTAIPADSVVDSYGVGIHLAFSNTPYADEARVAAALADLGVRHVRDDLFLGRPDQYAAIRTVAQDAGVAFDLIMGRPDRSGTPADYVATVADRLPPGAVESLEGVNEWDLFGGGDDWVAEMKSWQRELWDAAKAEPATADLPILAPALAFRTNYAEAGDMSAHADLANAHMYPGGHQPSNQIRQITDAVRTSIPRRFPLVTTEAGYHNALNADPSRHRAVPEDVAGLYLPRLLLEHVLRGEQRVYSYELVDEFEDAGRSEPEANFGLLRRDWSPKPAYGAMKNLLALLDDPGSAIAPGSLTAAIDGFPADGRYLLTQRRDGTFVLLLWRDVSVWDPARQTPQSVSPVGVTLRLAESADFAVHRPSSSPAAVSSASGTSLPLQLDAGVTAVVVDVHRPDPAPVPTAVTAARGDRSATVSWELSESTTPVTGVQVTRMPGDVVTRLPGGARSHRDTGLANGARYTYTVRALTATDASPAVAAPPVVPAGVPKGPRIASVRAKGRTITLAWRAAVDNGSTVTGYRLVCAGRTLTVAPGQRRATFTGLPPGRRLRVTLSARNDVGWGRAVRSAYVRTASR